LGGKTCKKGVKEVKHGKRPTRRQGELIKSKGLNWANWLVIKDTPEMIEIVHKYSGKTRRFQKQRSG
jgi:hypothetical protein